MYDLLYYYMGCFQVNDGNHAASPFGPFENGIEKYCNDYKNYNFNAWSVPYVEQNHFNSFIKNQIDLNRPAIMLFKEYNNKKDGDYGLHYTDIVGYAYTTDTSEPYYIIHDLWSTSDVYRNWNYDVSHEFLWMMFGITPN